jgi:hypothetical protein
LVLGGGAIGLLGCEVSKALGATHVAVVDISPERVDFALKEGFADGGWVMPRKPRADTREKGLTGAKETAMEILEWAGEQHADGFDVVLECTGVESCMQSAIHVGCNRSSMFRDLSVLTLAADSALERVERSFTSVWAPRTPCSPSPPLAFGRWTSLACSGLRELRSAAHSSSTRVMTPVDTRTATLIKTLSSFLPRDDCPTWPSW